MEMVSASKNMITKFCLFWEHLARHKTTALEKHKCAG